MRIETLTRHVVLAASIAMASCGSSANLPYCSWPPAGLDTDPSTRSSDRCLATRTLLSCALPGGATDLCASNNPRRCETNNPPGADDCHAECAENEFAATCSGGLLGGAIPDPPAGCHVAEVTPANTAFYCCPCGS